jgi:hypothetical protein
MERQVELLGGREWGRVAIENDIEVGEDSANTLLLLCFDLARSLLLLFPGLALGIPLLWLDRG